MVAATPLDPGGGRNMRSMVVCSASRQLLVGQVGQIGQALRDEEQDAEGEPLGAGGFFAEEHGEGPLGQRYFLPSSLFRLAAGSVDAITA